MSDRLTKLEPLPCPFCGVAITVIEGDEDSHDAWNHPEGPADGPECYLLGWELAYGDGDHERWNQRAESALRARHEKLREGLRGLRVFHIEAKAGDQGGTLKIVLADHVDALLEAE